MMKPARMRQLSGILLAILLLSMVCWLVLYALRQNISLFYSPTQLVEGQTPLTRSIRLGGMVVAGSIRRGAHDLKVDFDLTDYTKTVHVTYVGILPDLFREGTGVVSKGRFNLKDQQFEASEVLAKHDENYMPPEVKQAISLSTAKRVVQR